MYACIKLVLHTRANTHNRTHTNVHTHAHTQTHISGTVLEAVEQLAGMIKLQNYSTFTLFECRRPLSKAAQNNGISNEPITDEHLLLDDNK